MKRGEMTVSKLVAIVLAVVVLALVVYGFTTGGINPLIERMGMMADEVLIFLNIKDEGISDGCYSSTVADLSGGEKFLEDLGREGEEVVLNVCRGGRCDIEGDELGAYRFDDGAFGELVGGEWKKYNGVFVGDLAEIKLHYGLYGAIVDVLGGASMDGYNSVADFYEKKSFTGQFRLGGDGNGLLDDPSSAVWEDGVWTVVANGEDPVKTKVDKTAIEMFAAAANDGAFYDKITWGITFRDDSLSRGGTIDGYDNDLNWEKWEDYGKSALIPIDDYIGRIDTDTDIKNLKIAFADIIKVGLLDEVEISEEELDNFKDIVGNKEVGVEGKKFIAGVDDKERFPILTFSPEGLGVIDDVDEKILSDEEITGIYNALAMTEHRGKVIKEEYEGDVDGEYYYVVEGIGGYSPWIRTNASGTGSSAYGPVQVTMSLIRGTLKDDGRIIGGYLNNGEISWDSDEREYLDAFIVQGINFLKVDDALERATMSQEDFLKYDYGGVGDLTSLDDELMYEQVMKRIIKHIAGKYNGDYDKILRDWTSGASKMEEPDKGYEIAFYESLGIDVPKLKVSLSSESVFGLAPDYKNRDLRFLSLLEKINGEWKDVGEKGYYILKDDKFNGRYEATVISRFLVSKCRV